MVVGSNTIGALIVSVRLVPVKVAGIWIMPPLLSKSGLPPVAPMV